MSWDTLWAIVMIVSVMHAGYRMSIVLERQDARRGRATAAAFLASTCRYCGTGLGVATRCTGCGASSDVSHG